MLYLQNACPADIRYNIQHTKRKGRKPRGFEFSCMKYKNNGNKVDQDIMCIAMHYSALQLTFLKSVSLSLSLFFCECECD